MSVSDSQPASRSRANSGARFGVSILLSVLAGASILLASVGVWVNNTVFNSSKFAETVEKSLDDPAVNVALSDYLADQIITALDVEIFVSDLLPENLLSASVIFVGALRTVVDQGVQEVLADDRVQQLISDQVESSHAVFMTVLRDQGPFGEGLSTDGNKVILDLKPIILRAADDLDRVGVVIDRLELPEDFGQIVVYEGDKIEQSSNLLRSAQDGLTLYKRLLWLFLLLAPILTAASIYVASNRRTATRRLGITVAAVSAAVLVALSQVNSAVSNLISEPKPRAAARVITDNFVGRLNNFNWFLLILTVLTIVVTTFYRQLSAVYGKYRTRKTTTVTS